MLSYIRRNTILWIIAATVALGSLTGMFLPANSARAVTTNDWTAGNIISDSIFFNAAAMNSQQIQNFLNAKVPNCRAGYTCLKDYRQDTPYRGGEPYLCSTYGGGNKSATEIIYDVAQVCGINPQVLLILLQKEQSLVTDDWPLADQYRSATGFGCPDSAPCDAEYYGFFNQVYNAARIYKKYARDANLYNYRAGRNNNIYYQADNRFTPQNEMLDCGFSPVYIQNQATAGLYVYTPYQPNRASLDNMYTTGDGCSSYGNRNFWRMFSDWFGSTQGSMLVRTPSSPTYYLLTAGARYAIPNGDILYAYGLETQRVDVVSDNYLNSLANGGMLGTLFTTPGDNTVFLADLNRKIGIASGEYCTRWGLACGNTTYQKVIGREIFDRMAQSGPLQAIMNYNNNYYLMENGVKKHFLSPGALVERGYSTSYMTTVGNFTNATRSFGPSLPESNTFVKFASNNAIYLYANNAFFSIPDYNTFLSWYGNNGASYLDPNSSYNTQPPSVSGSLSSLVENGSNKYLLDNGKRINLTSVASDWPAGMNGSSLTTMLNRFPITSTATSANSYRTSDGAIFKVTGQQKRIFNSVYDYLALNTGPTIQLSSSNIPIPNGSLLLAEGSAYKILGSDTIYFIGKDSKSYAFTSVKQISDFGTNLAIPNISSSNASQFTYQSALSARVTDSQNNVYVINSGKRYLVSPSMASNWGVSTVSNNILSDNYLNKLPLGNPLSTFIGAPNGTIYTYGNGNKRPIATYQKYISLGGNINNTISLPADVVDSLPTGPVLN